MWSDVRGAARYAGHRHCQWTLAVGEFLWRTEQVFDWLDYACSGTDRLFTIQQGERSVAEYKVEFYLLAEETGWN